MYSDVDTQSENGYKWLQKIIVGADHHVGSEQVRNGKGTNILVKGPGKTAEDARPIADRSKTVGSRNQRKRSGTSSTRSSSTRLVAHTRDLTSQQHQPEPTVVLPTKQPQRGNNGKEVN